MAILCPKCQDDLMSQNTQILGSQVTLTYEIVGELEIDCEKCGEDVGAYLKKRMNAYSRLVNTILPADNVFKELADFIGSVEVALEIIEQNRGGPRRAKSIRLYFGLDDGVGMTHKQVGNAFGTSRTRAWVI